MKHLHQIFLNFLLLILLGGHLQAQQTETATIETNLLESKGIMSFRPLDMMKNPQMLMKVWLDEPMPLSFYTEEEKEVQKRVNEKTTDGIITYSPLSQEKEWTSIDFEEITPYTWKWIDLEMYKEDGTLSKIHLRRPHWWMREMEIDKVGKKVYLEMPEMGIIGYATVKKIRLNQLDTRFWDEKREGDYVSRPITGKFEHESKEVYHLYFGNNAKPLGVTASHPIWSIDRNDWIDAGDLRIGEKVKTKEYQVTLKSREKVAGTHKVYNLEIYKDHNFLVSTDKILVHNNCDLDRLGKDKVSDIVGNTKILAGQDDVDAGIIRKYAQDMLDNKFDWNNMSKYGREDKMIIYEFSDGVQVVGEGHHRFVAAQITGTRIPFDNPNAVKIQKIPVPSSDWSPATNWSQVRWR